MVVSASNHCFRACCCGEKRKLALNFGWDRTVSTLIQTLGSFVVDFSSPVTGSSLTGAGTSSSLALEGDRTVSTSIQTLGSLVVASPVTFSSSKGVGTSSSLAVEGFRRTGEICSAAGRGLVRSWNVEATSLDSWSGPIVCTSSVVEGWSLTVGVFLDAKSCRAVVRSWNGNVTTSLGKTSSGCWSSSGGCWSSSGGRSGRSSWNGDGTTSLGRSSPSSGRSSSPRVFAERLGDVVLFQPWKNLLISMSFKH